MLTVVTLKESQVEGLPPSNHPFILLVICRRVHFVCTPILVQKRRPMLFVVATVSSMPIVKIVRWSLARTSRHRARLHRRRTLTGGVSPLLAKSRPLVSWNLTRRALSTRSPDGIILILHAAVLGWRQRLGSTASTSIGRRSALGLAEDARWNRQLVTVLAPGSSIVLTTSLQFSLLTL